MDGRVNWFEDALRAIGPQLQTTLRRAQSGRQDATLYAS
jgi:hypothetical protein